VCLNSVLFLILGLEMFEANEDVEPQESSSILHPVILHPSSKPALQRKHLALLRLTLALRLSTLSQRVTAGLWPCLRAIKKRNGFTCCQGWVEEIYGENGGLFCNGRLSLACSHQLLWQFCCISSANMDSKFIDHGWEIRV